MKPAPSHRAPRARLSHEQRNGDLLPPHDEAAEAGALACVLSAVNGEAEHLLAQVSLEDFHDHRHRKIYSALARFQKDGKQLTVVQLAQVFRDEREMQDAGGISYVANLPEQTPSVANFPSFLEVLKDRATRRAALRDAAEVSTLARDTTIPASQIAEVAQRFTEAYSRRKSIGFTVRKPSEFLAMRFDDSDRILGDRLLATGQPLVIAAAGGTGKSRLLFQAAGCVVSGQKFLTFETGGANLRWLILQTENSNRRLRDDLTRLQAWLGDDWQQFEERVFIHAIETDTDSFVSLDIPENVANISAAIEDTKPDVVGIDPLNDFAIGDLNKDADMKATLQALSRVCRKGNPSRSIVVLHHALTGRGGAAKATGYDRSSFARNSKSLHAWARGQINLAPVDEDSNDRLIVACGKCSNGREFLPFGVRLNPETMIYECDPSVDVAQWQTEINGQADRGPLINHDRVAELCGIPKTKAELARAIRDDCGCARTVAYRYIRRAETARKIRFNPKTESYAAR